MTEVISSTEQTNNGSQNIKMLIIAEILFSLISEAYDNIKTTQSSSV